MTTKVNIILITHETVGTALLDAVKMALGTLPLPTTVIAVTHQDDPDKIVAKLKKHVDSLINKDPDQRFLILTDLFGATPSNIASRLQKCEQKDKINVVAGLNLPMLIRVMNYSSLPLEQLTQKAVSGGKDGIINY